MRTGCPLHPALQLSLITCQDARPGHPAAQTARTALLMTAAGGQRPLEDSARSEKNGLGRLPKLTAKPLGDKDPTRWAPPGASLAGARRLDT